MKQILLTIFCMALVLETCACSQSAPTEQEHPTWQEQYDLGIRYLSEGNYEEAIIAFTAAIEIDPKRAEAYVGRGDAYVGSAPEGNMTEQTLEFEKAEADYLTAMEINSLSTEIYEKLAELYLVAGDVDSAIAILEQGYQTTGDEKLKSHRQELGVIGSDEVIWSDSVFERLIRDKIGIPDRPIYVKDLDEVTSLGIFGDTVVFINDGEETGWGWRYINNGDENSDRGPLFAYYGTNDGQEYTIRGKITNVDALKYFRNLKSIHIIANHITDISVLDKLSDLEYANFWANDISNIFPLERLPYDSSNAEQFIEIGDILNLWID